ncbi:MAG: peptidase M75, Imelysin [Hyphomicrobiales bacterium]|nr:peptidase M75, Imelysin [Hyphomicrobiales bacterium]PCH49771.1 MAG: peptidase M75, Imelysin [Hyphomicrobiales bacterium]
MNFKIANICFLGVLAFSSCFVQSANSKLSKQKIEGVLKASVENIVRPRLNEFKEKAIYLNEAMQALCETPNEENLKASRDEFKKLAIAWGGIEHFRSGPIKEQNRLERVLFYPDRKSTGLKQVQRRLVKKDATLTELKSLQSKSVAVQGLGAIEFLLFGTGSNDLVSTSADFRCKFAKTASANVEAISSELQGSWQAGSDFSKRWMQAGNSGSIFANEQEAINELLGVLVHGLEVFRDIRIGGFLKKEAKYDRPKSALLWRSQSTLPVLKANFKMFEGVMEEGGLYSLVEEDLNGTVNSLRFEFKQIKNTLNSISPPIADALGNEKQRAKLHYIKNTLGYLIERIDGEFALMLGLSSGFSFSDGD